MKKKKGGVYLYFSEKADVFLVSFPMKGHRK
jgi:hypothetical protein